MEQKLHLEEHFDGQCLRWKFVRAHKRNALGDQVFKELDQSLRKLENRCKQWLASPNKIQAPAKALLIEADIGNFENPVWISGGDLKEHAAKNAREGKIYIANYTKLCTRFEKLPLPIIMSIDGAVIGGGIELALSADLRFATRRSRFDFRQTDIGLATGFGGGKRLVECVGRSRSSYWLLTSQVLSAEDLLQEGLVHELADDQLELRILTEKYVQNLCIKETRALAVQKQMLLYVSLASANPKRELSLFQSLWKNETHKKTLERFT